MALIFALLFALVPSAAALLLRPASTATASAGLVRGGPRCCATTAVDCRVHGLSVSEAGLVALLSCDGRLRPLLVTDSDTQSASSPEALCLLQLLQGIDLGGATLPPEALGDAAGAGSVLRAVEIASGGDSCALRVATSDGAEIVAADLSPFRALALALRYDAPISVAPQLFDAPEGFPEAECAARYPRCFSRADAVEQRSGITRRLAGLGERPEASRPPTAGGDSDSFSFADAGSLDIVEAVAQALPATPPPSPPRRIDGPDAALLQRALAIAREKGDAAAEEKILQRLAELPEE